MPLLRQCAAVRWVMVAVVAGAVCGWLTSAWLPSWVAGVVFVLVVAVSLGLVPLGRPARRRLVRSD